MSGQIPEWEPGPGSGSPGSGLLLLEPRAGYLKPGFIWMDN